MADSTAHPPVTNPPLNSAAESNKSGRLELKRFVRFVAVGVLNTAFGYGVFATVFVLTHRQVAAVIAANVIGVIFNYFTIGGMVFANKGIKALAPFFFGYLIVTLVNLGSVEALTALSFSPFVAQAIAVPVLVAISYSWNRFLVFRDRD